jgi:hypothetical protein
MVHRIAALYQWVSAFYPRICVQSQRSMRICGGHCDVTKPNMRWLRAVQQDLGRPPGYPPRVVAPIPGQHPPVLISQPIQRLYYCAAPKKFEFSEVQDPNSWGSP